MINSINYAITKGFSMQTEKVYNFLNFSYFYRNELN